MRLTCSVIVTSHDPKRIEWLKECLESVYQQTVKPDRVILINNHEEFPDMASKLNYGISKCETDTYIPLADDDILHPNFVKRVLQTMQRDECDIVYTDMELFGIDPRLFISPDWTYENISKGDVIPITSLIRTDVWKKHPYEPIQYLDWNFWWSAYENFSTTSHVREFLFRYRTHPDQLSRNLTGDPAKEVLQRHAHS